MTTGSAVVRRSLGRQLKALREGAGLSAADVYTSHLKVASKTKLQRIEAGKGAVRIADVRLLCEMYGADAPTTQKLGELALNSSEGGWWEAYGDVMPSWFSTYVELEAAATSVSTYDPELIFGLLQTPAYQQSVFEVDPRYNAELVERQKRLRSERQQEAFERTPPLRISAILGEGAVARLVGGPGVMAEQRERLSALGDLGHVQILVLPWDAGAHVAMKGAFTIVGFDGDEDPDVVYLETLAGGRYVEQPAIIERYRQNFKLITDQSVSIKEYLA